MTAHFQWVRQVTATAGEPGQAPIDNVIKAIAAFQRTLISGNSRYDQWLASKATLSDAELRAHKPWAIGLD